MGKTRLAAEIRRGCEHLWLEGHCHELTRDVPFAGITDLLRRHLGRRVRDADGVVGWLESLGAAPDMGPERVDEVAPFLADLLDVPFGDRRDLAVVNADPAQRRRLTIDAVTSALKAMSDVHPVVVFVDDLHWADSLTVDTLAQVGGRATPGRLFVLATTRPDDSGAVDRLTAADAGLLRIELAPLTDTESTALLRGLLAISGLPGDVEGDLVSWAAGNPFYVEELIRSLIQRGMVRRVDDRWIPGDTPARLEIPDSVDGVVMSRYDRLAPATRRAGQIAAVLDRTFTDDLFRQVAGSEPTGTLGTLVTADFLERVDTGYRFIHALTREAVYASLLPSQKSELHHQVATVLESVEPDDHESLAHHYERTSDHLAAVVHLLEAGRRAMARYLNDAAADHIERGLSRITSLPAGEQPGWPGRYLLTRGALRERMADYGAALADLARAEELAVDVPGDLVTIRRLMGRVSRLEGDFETAHAWLDRAESAIRPEDQPSEWIDLQVERAQTLYFGGRGREIPTLVDRVTPPIDLHGTPAQRADALGFRALHGFVVDRFRMSDVTLDLCTRALHIAEEDLDVGRIADARFRLGFCLLWADRMREATPSLGHSLTEARRVGEVMLETRAAAYRAVALRRIGAVEETAAAVDEALDIARHVGDDYYQGHALATRSWVRWRSGNLDEAVSDATDALDCWGPLTRGAAAGADVEFAWMAVWPLTAATHALGDDDAVAAHLPLLTVPWERPMSEALTAAVIEAIDDPEHSIGRALDLAIGEALL